MLLMVRCVREATERTRTVSTTNGTNESPVTSRWIGVQLIGAEWSARGIDGMNLDEAMWGEGGDEDVMRRMPWK